MLAPVGTAPRQEPPQPDPPIFDAPVVVARTASERRVVRMTAGGLTSRDIARRAHETVGLACAMGLMCQPLTNDWTDR